MALRLICSSSAISAYFRPSMKALLMMVWSISGSVPMAFSIFSNRIRSESSFRAEQDSMVNVALKNSM